MGKSQTAKGRDFEGEAAQYLRELGYTIVTRNFTIRGGEVDIIALDGEELVFVEVRWRADDHAEWSVSSQKSAALRRCAVAYLDSVPEQREHRFDFVAIGPSGIRHSKNYLF